MQQSRSPFAAHQRKKSPRGYSPRKSPLVRGYSPKNVRKSPFACGFSPRGSRWATKSPYNSLFSRGPSPRKSPFAVKSMEYHLPASYGECDGTYDIFRQKKSNYYPDLNETPNSSYFSIKDPNIRCMDGGPECFVKPKYEAFEAYGVRTKKQLQAALAKKKSALAKKNAVCYNGYKHGQHGKTCFHAKYPTKLLKTPCTGPKGVCSEPMANVECYSGFMHGKKAKVCRRLENPTKYYNTQCFGPKINGIRPTSCDIITQKFTDEQITKMAEYICKNYKAEDYEGDTSEAKLKKLFAFNSINFQKLSAKDTVSLLEKLESTCFKTKLTINEIQQVDTTLNNSEGEIQIQALESLLRKEPETAEKVDGAISVGKAVSKNLLHLDDTDILKELKSEEEKEKILEKTIAKQEESGQDTTETKGLLSKTKDFIMNNKKKIVSVAILSLAVAADSLYNEGAAANYVTESVTDLLTKGIALSQTAKDYLLKTAVLVNAKSAANSVIESVSALPSTLSSCLDTLSSVLDNDLCYILDLANFCFLVKDAAVILLL